MGKKSSMKNGRLKDFPPGQIIREEKSGAEIKMINYQCQVTSSFKATGLRGRNISGFQMRGFRQAFVVLVTFHLVS